MFNQEISISDILASLALLVSIGTFIYTWLENKKRDDRLEAVLIVKSFEINGREEFEYFIEVTNYGKEFVVIKQIYTEHNKEFVPVLFTEMCEKIDRFFENPHEEAHVLYDNAPLRVVFPIRVEPADSINLTIDDSSYSSDQKLVLIDGRARKWPIVTKYRYTPSDIKDEVFEDDEDYE